MNIEARTEYVPGDPTLIRDIISQLKSQGVFDQFRKECISDVDTKPAYQNLCHRVDGQVSSYLSDIRWGPDLNKNQLRENIRKFVNKCTFVEPGISRIVDQLVNPRINTVLVPKVEDIVYQYVGIPPIERPVPKESHDSNGNHKFDSQDSSFEKSWSSSSSYKRNHDNEPSWLRSPSKKFDNFVHSKMDSSSSLPSLFDLKVEPPDDLKDKNEDSRNDFFHSEGGEDDTSRAYSTIDSDEDNLNDDVEEPSPAFEPFDLPDTCNSASVDSDYPTEVANLTDDGPPGLEADEKSMLFHVEHHDENTNHSLDDRSSQNEPKVFEETAPAQFEVPKTPTINYETSEDSDDNALKTNTLTEVSAEHASLADDIPDFSSVDKIAQKIAEDNRDQEKMVADDVVVLKNGDYRQKTVESKPKESKTDEHPEKDSKSDSKHRDRKYSEHRKDKHKSDKRDSSRDDRERKHREKERHDSSKSKSSKSRTESRDKTRKSSDEKEPPEEEASKSKSKDEHKSHRSHDDRKSRDKDKQKSGSSSERRSKEDKSKRSRSDDTKEDRKKRHDDRSKESKRSSQDDGKVKRADESKEAKKHEGEKVKLKKPDAAESKKSGKSQCGTDEKKVRTDRRSSDRDSNGPSSNHSHHRSTSRSDKEKHSDKSRHSSSMSSHKSKKSDNSKSVSSGHSEDGCDSSAHHEKRKDEKVSSRPDLPKDPVNSKAQEDVKHKEQSHEKKKDVTEPFSDLESKRLEEVKLSKISANPLKRSLVEVNAKEATSPADLPDGQNSPLKIAENTSFGIKKPKIARNQFEFGKMVRLRKEYKEKMRLLQQQGKENNSESCKQNEEKQILGRLSPVPSKEPKTVSNGSKNGLIKDLKLSITRIDACYKIVNGSCLINDSSPDDDVFIMEPVKPKTDETLKLNIKPVPEEKPDKLIKLKICRSISPTSGKERTKCVQSSIYEGDHPKTGKERTKSGEVPSEVTKSPTREIEDSKGHPIEEIAVKSVPVPENKEESVFYPPSENEDELEEEVLNEDLLCQMNIEEIIGCRTDCTRISYDSGLNGEKNVSEVVEAVKEHVVDKNVLLFDEDNKENVGTESQCVNDVTANRVLKKSSPEVNYFEPCSPTNDFTRFVKKLVRESEDVSLLNFSVQLDYPREYDAIFRSQLGASVSRVGKLLEGASTVSSRVADTLPEVEETLNTPTNELKPINEFSGILNSAESRCDSSHDYQSVAPVQKAKVANTTKRKTLGIKRRISSVGGNAVCRTASASSDPIESRVCHPASTVAENNAKKRALEISAISHAETSALNTYSHEFSSVADINLSRVTGPIAVGDEKQRIYPSINNNLPPSSSYPIPAKTPKKPRKQSPVRASDEILTEIVPKRTPYKNKCYYDSSDLYKPRPSFLASSRRSRALNPESK